MIITYINMFDAEQKIVSKDGELLATSTLDKLPDAIIKVLDEDNTVYIYSDLAGVDETLAKVLKQRKENIIVRSIKNV